MTKKKFVDEIRNKACFYHCEKPSGAGFNLLGDHNMDLCLKTVFTIARYSRELDLISSATDISWNYASIQLMKQ
jgi:hypothetical protein